MAEPVRESANESIGPKIHPDLGVSRNTNPEGELNKQESNPETPNTDSIADQEANGNSYKNNYTGTDDKSSKGSSKFSFLKKKGPLALIISIVIGGSFGLSVFFSPAMLLLQVKEAIVNRFDNQDASLNIRATKMLNKKILGGACTIEILCKYSSFSDKQVANLKKAGIEVVVDEELSSPGKIHPKNFIVNGETIQPGELTLKTTLASAIKEFYNSKFAGMSDKIFTGKVESELKITKKAPTYEGATDDEKMANMDKDLATKTKATRTPNVVKDDIDPDTGEKYVPEGLSGDALKIAEENLKTANANIDKVNNLLDLAGGEGASASSKIANGITEANKWLGVSALVTTAGDTACTLYRTYLAVGLAAKVFRVVQTANYAMQFLNVPDQIKAGDAKDGDVSFLGTILTKESVNDSGVAESGTDSPAYKYIEYGEVGKTSTASMQAMAAGGLSGALSNFKGLATAAAKKAEGTVCKVLGSVVFNLTSLLAGLALTLVPGAGEADALKLATMASKLKVLMVDAVKSPLTWGVAGLSGVTFLAENYLPNLLKDIITGNVADENTVGGNAMNLAVSGASTILGTAAKYGGNAPLTAAQAIQYDKIKEDVAAQYAKEDQIAYNPLDATHSNTFMGKVASWIIPYTSKMSSLSSTFSSVASIVTKSFAFLVPQTANAATMTTDSYSTCQDTQYSDLTLATDIFCNVVYGIPGVEDSPDPVTVASALLNQKNPSYGLDNVSDQEHTTPTIPLIKDNGTTNPSGDTTKIYYDFIANCINRDRTKPLVKSSDSSYTYTDPSGTKDGGASECIFNNSRGVDDPVQSWTNCTERGDIPKETDEISRPNPGLVYITKWETATPYTGPQSTDPKACQITKVFKRHVYYIGNEYFYLNFIDNRVNSGMDGI
jgi:hypothetical protein